MSLFYSYAHPTAHRTNMLATRVPSQDFRRPRRQSSGMAAHAAHIARSEFCDTPSAMQRRSSSIDSSDSEGAWHYAKHRDSMSFVASPHYTPFTYNDGKPRRPLPPVPAISTSSSERSLKKVALDAPDSPASPRYQWYLGGTLEPDFCSSPEEDTHGTRFRWPETSIISINKHQPTIPSRPSPPRSESSSTSSSGRRSVRFHDNPVESKPTSSSPKRKGWFNRRGDQLWSNEGDYFPAKEACEFPPELSGYPDAGHGWMNEDGVHIDMRHRLVMQRPLRSALKKRSSTSTGRSASYESNL